MPVNVPPTATGKRRFRLAVETDPHKLVNYCCGINYHKDEPLVKLKPDNEYPDWLWTLRLTEKPNSWEMEKGTKEYYLRLAEEGKERNYLLRMKSAKEKKVVAKHLLARIEYKHHLRFAALAHLEEDNGFDSTSTETDWYKYFQRSINMRDYYLPLRNEEIYMDTIYNSMHTKNYDYDHENTFKRQQKTVVDQIPKMKPAILDRKQRHRYAGT